MRADLVPDDLRERLAPLLPPVLERRHRPPGRLCVPDRGALAGVMSVLRTGVAWRDVPAETMGCSGVTAWSRLREWTKAGVWPRLHVALLTELRRGRPGHDALRTYFGSRPADRLSRRICTDILVTVTSADTAATTYFTTYRVDGYSEGLVPLRPPVQVGHYEDTFRKVDDTWLLATRTLFPSFAGPTERLARPAQS